MLQKVVAVRDSAMGMYMRPFTVPTAAMAVRSFSDEVNRNAEDNQMFKHPEDYELHCLGEFDEESGMLVSQHSVLVRGKDVFKGA